MKGHELYRIQTWLGDKWIDNKEVTEVTLDEENIG